MRLARIILPLALALHFAWTASRGAPVAAPRSGSGSATGAVATLVRQPVLQRVTDRAATIVWATDAPGAGEVRYGVPGGPTSHATATIAPYPAAQTGMARDYFQFEALLTDLQPLTTYAYDILLDGIALTPSTDRLTTAPLVGTGTIRFIAFGDSGAGGQRQLQLAGLMEADSLRDAFDLAIHTGDVVYPKGTYQLLHDRFFAVYEPWLRRRPAFLSFGNHEEYAAQGRPYFDVFVLPDNGGSTTEPGTGERYYSFDYGPVHFVALDTQAAFSSGARRQEQLTWLARDLEATRQPWRIVFFHRPAYGSGGNTLETAGVRDPLQSIFERYGVQLVLSGHEHAYARSTPWREGSSDGRAVVHVVTGGGGASLNSPQPSPWLARWSGVHHYLRITVTDCTASGSCELQLEAVNGAGAVFDQFLLPLREQAADSARPELAWHSPADGAVVSGRLPVTAAVTDDTRIVKVDLFVNGELTLVDYEAPFELSWETTEALNGAHTVELRAWDLAGHETRSQPRTVLVNNPLPAVRLLSPASGDRAFTELPYRVRWAAGAGDSPFLGFDVHLSLDGGKTFGPLPGCTGLEGTARECLWSAPGPAVKKAIVQVAGIDAAGRTAVRRSGVFEIRSGAATLELKRPDQSLSVASGSRQAVTWSSNLGAGSLMDLDVSLDGGASWLAVARAIPNPGTLRWPVGAEETSQGLMRVRALALPLEDISGGFLQIEAPRLRPTIPSASTVWTAGGIGTVKWTGNLGVYDRLNVRLSLDDGTTFPLLLAASVPATQGKLAVALPAQRTETARILIESVDRPAWAAGSSPRFAIR